jgi:hypothetical protein
MRVVRCTPGELGALIAADVQRLDARVKTIGMAGVAIDGAHIIADNTPVAFADLRESVHADVSRFLEGFTRSVVSAPHAAPVEKGSRPHVPPLAPLIAWVKLRGMQGIDKRGKIRSPGRKAWGNTTAANAHRVAVALKSLERPNGSLHLDAPVKIARAIQASIAKHGTRPHWFVRDSLKKIRSALDRRMKKAVRGT